MAKKRVITMGCTRSRWSRGFQCLASLPRPGEPGRYAAKTIGRLIGSSGNVRPETVGTSSQRKQSVCSRTIKNEHPAIRQFSCFSGRYFIVLLPHSKLSPKAPSSRYLHFFARASLQALQESQQLRRNLLQRSISSSLLVTSLLTNNPHLE